MMLTLYFSPGSSAMATHIALHEIGVPFEAKLVSLAKGEQHSPEYRTINPEGKVPTLLIDGRKLTEVAATLGCSVGNVKSQASRALAKLRLSSDLAEGSCHEHR